MPRTYLTPEAVDEKYHATYPFPPDWHPAAAELGRIALMLLMLTGVCALAGLWGQELIQTALGGAVVWRLAYGLSAPRPKPTGEL